MTLIKRLEKVTSERISAYKASLGDIKEHYGIEESMLAGGYGYRQILELIQNGADAILEACETETESSKDNRIEVRLTKNRLYVANTGQPISPDGLEAILRSHISPKRGWQIGRFGLGFKSLLALKGKIDVFTHDSGCIDFDPERCRETLKEQFDVPNAPGLRLAWPIEPNEWQKDPVLEQMKWAATVVRAEINGEGVRSALVAELQRFPAEFLLFSPIEFVLELFDENEKKSISVEDKGAIRILRDGDRSSHWRLFEAPDVRVKDKEAREDATNLHARKSVPITWALPLQGKREEAGRFWAFFPTQTQTRIPGILNAPWKLNSDRTNLIGGAWNKALMTEAAKLIAQSLPELATSDDPALPLDFFPRRLDRQDELAAPLVESLWQAIGVLETIADGTGVLRCGRDLWRHPEGATVEMAQQWTGLAEKEDQQKLVHPLCLPRQRASRLEALAEYFDTHSDVKQNRPNLEFIKENKWFEEIATINIQDSIEVMRLAERYIEIITSGYKKEELRKSFRIIPIKNKSDEDLHVDIPEIALICPPDMDIPERYRVLPDLVKDKEGRRLLVEVMKVEEYGDDAWKTQLSGAFEKAKWHANTQKGDAWKKFWTLLRQAPAGVSTKFIDDMLERARKSVFVQREDKQWVVCYSTFFPGCIIKENDSEHNKLLLISKEHIKKDTDILEILDIKSEPTHSFNEYNYEKIAEWINKAVTLYHTCDLEYNKLRHFPRDKYLRPWLWKMPACWTMLPKLVGMARARLTEALLEIIGKDDLTTVEFAHSTRKNNYPVASYAHPALWWLCEHGSLAIDEHIFPLRAALANRDNPILHKMLNRWKEWSELFPPDDARPPDTLFPDVAISDDDRASLWRAIILAQNLPESLEGNEFLDDLFEHAARDGYIPEKLHWNDKTITLGQVMVTSSGSLARYGRKGGFYALVLERQTKALWLDNGAQDISGKIEVTYQDQYGKAMLLVDRFPDIKPVLYKKLRKEAACLDVKNLRLRIRNNEQPLPCAMEGNTLLVDRDVIADKTRRDRLQCILDAADEARWLDVPPSEALDKIMDEAVEARRQAVKNEPNLAARLLAAVGRRKEPLLEALGDVGKLEKVAQCNGLELAELVINQLGLATLTNLRDVLEKEGLKPPGRMSTSKAREFVDSIGFPANYAISKTSKREPVETVSGPIHLPPLHDFQEDVYSNIEKLLNSGKMRRRAVISLPTGGGKTRVVVEAAVCLILKKNDDVLWIAQNDELCEQAVQAFRQVWINKGAEGVSLSIQRCWGSNIVPPVEEGHARVVVTTIQTFNSRYKSFRLEKGNKPCLVVIDECHHAITKSYTNVLRHLDAAGHERQADDGAKEPLILGLSATPFRCDDEESERLAKRFNSTWFPENQESLNQRLLEQKVLARAVHMPIETAAKLLKDEEEKFEKYYGEDNFDGTGLEFETLLEKINVRLAGDQDRNSIIVDYIKNSNSKSILFFANSVAHANEMAAILTIDGIPSVSVSGKTPVSVRRDFLQKFQDNKIRILCNHSVLSTGFDAPKTDMILISRQIFSPVRYMQIVGRGLRGIKNGGTEECNIVTVKDNLGRFWKMHPYNYCKKYFPN